MKRLVLRWLALAVFLSALAYLFVQLGEWQLSRLEERRDANDVVLANQDQPVVDYREAMGGEIADSAQWQRVRLTGHYSAEQYQVRYRSLAGAPGIEVAAVFTTDQGDELIVDRGFIARQPGQPDPEDLPALPSGKVTLVGYVRASETGNQNAATPHEFKVRLIDPATIGASLGKDLLDGYVSLLSAEPAEDPILTPITPPELTEGNHFSYALQWFSFSVIAIVGMAVLIRADLADRRKAKRLTQKSDAGN